MNMKTKLRIATALAVACSAWFGLRVQGQEKTQVQRSIVLVGSTNALNQARIYLDQGASWVLLSHPLFSTDTNKWRVDATFNQ